MHVHREPDRLGSKGKLNALRAAVLGANDGIVSVAAIVVGVAAATHSRGAIVTAGLAGLVAGTMSMAAGEYVSVGSQRDTEGALIAREKQELHDYPNEELQELAQIYRSKGLTAKTSDAVAKELMQYNALASHAEVELGINPEKLVSPWQAAIASACSFLAGGWIPLATAVLSAASWRIAVTFIAVVAALCLTGYLSALAGGANIRKAMVRVVVGGALAMAVTYFIGRLVGTTVS